MFIRNWHKRNVFSAKKIEVNHVVASGKTPESWVQIRVVSKDEKRIHLTMDPDEAAEVGRLLQSHSNRLIEYEKRKRDG